MYAQKQITRRVVKAGGHFTTKIAPERLNDTAVLERIWAARGITDTQELSFGLTGLLSPEKLLHIDTAVNLLVNAIESEKFILIIGDYDTDGATSCALSVLALRAMGAKAVDYLVPNRFDFGYGLTPEIVDVAISTRKPDLIMTVDNGISSIDGVEYARSQGIAVLVTDHHLPPEQLPKANAIVNPNQLGDCFPSKALAGVGVAFYLMSALRQRLRQLGWFSTVKLPVPNMADFLDLVALGTVADMVPLDKNNRILVAQGVARIQRRKCRPGIISLATYAKRKIEQLVASDLGYYIAPRLNAAGRLDDISVGVECLLASDELHAQTLARSLDDINAERRSIQATMERDAIKIVQKLNLAQDGPAGICLYKPDWHHGIVGLIASRIREQTDKPAVVFAPDQDGYLKGSARSVNGLHIRDLFDVMDKRFPSLIERFGGHAMAAGLTIAEHNFAQFEQGFHRCVATQLGKEKVDNILLTDGALSADSMNQPFAQLVQNAAPWGQGFPAPVFDNHFDVVEQRLVGENHIKFRLRLTGQSQQFDAIAFRALAENQELDLSIQQIHAVYHLDINEFRGARSLQLIIEYFEPLPSLPHDGR